MRASNLSPRPVFRGLSYKPNTQELTMLSLSTRNEPKHHKVARASLANNSMRSARKHSPTR